MEELCPMCKLHPAIIKKEKVITVEPIRRNMEMTNREWLQSMAMIDMLTLFNRSSEMCIFELLGIPNCADRCDKFSDEEKSVDDCCYNCLCSWLNEKKF